MSKISLFTNKKVGHRTIRWHTYSDGHMYAHIYICPYIQMYARMYLHMYVCMYVCKYIPTYLRTYLRRYVRTYVCERVLLSSSSVCTTILTLTTTSRNFGGSCSACLVVNCCGTRQDVHTYVRMYLRT